jgi:hypothetical protein
LSWLLSYFVNMAEDVLSAEGDGTSIAELAKLKADPNVRFSALTEDALRHLPLRGLGRSPRAWGAISQRYPLAFDRWPLLRRRI